MNLGLFNFRSRIGESKKGKVERARAEIINPYKPVKCMEVSLGLANTTHISLYVPLPFCRNKEQNSVIPSPNATTANCQAPTPLARQLPPNSHACSLSSRGFWRDREAACGLPNSSEGLVNSSESLKMSLHGHLKWFHGSDMLSDKPEVTC